MGNQYEEYEDYEDGTNELQENNGANNQQGNNTNQEEQPKEVKLSKFKVGSILVALFLFLAFVIYVISRSSVSKEVKTQPEPENQQTMEQGVDIEVPVNAGETELNNSENLVESNDANSSPSEEVKTENTSTEQRTTESQVTEVTVDNSDTTNTNDINNILNGSDSPEGVEPQTSGINQVVELALSEEISTQGIVTGMSVYKLDTSYIYGVNILVVTGNGSNADCMYFCPKRTYDSLAIGDALQVIYQLDGAGNISVSSISK